MRIDEYVKPKTFYEASDLLDFNDRAVIIGGGAYLHLTGRYIKLGIDLSDIDADFIKEKDDIIEIGAMTTLREIEKSEILNKYFNGILSKVARKIMGVQIRNVATVGGSLASRLGFSDLITALITLDCQVVLHKRGTLPLEEFLKVKHKDIIEKVILKKSNTKAVYLDFRNTSTDFAVLNVSASTSNGICKIAVGARPGIACIAICASDIINTKGFDISSIEKAAEEASEELNFSDDIRASAEYRKELCKVLVKRALREVSL